MSLLVVYNTCGIRNTEDTNYYLYCLGSILNQRNNPNSPKFDVAISACMAQPKTKDMLKRAFRDNIFYNFTDEILPVNVTFNHTVRETVKRKGEYEAYVYVDSGVNFGNRTDVLERMYRTYKSGPYAMAAVLADNDNAMHHILGYDGYNSNDVIIPVGKAINCHTQIFSNDLYKTYGERLIPDIFASFCTESVFSFLCAAIKQKWVVVGDLVLEHRKGIDGASSGFPNNHPWDHTFRSPRTMAQLIQDEDGKRAGWGYEECNRILMHDPACYDENGFCKNDELAPWMAKNIFVQKDMLDYDTIKSEFIG